VASGRVSNAEVKAGLFLTFCLGLLVAMLFIYSRATHHWRGRQDLRVLFTNASMLRLEAAVRYNGLEVGRVRKISILPLDDSALALLPPFTGKDLEDLPLREAEREELRGVPAADFDPEIRRRLQGRLMVELVLEVLAEGDQKRYREDDRIQILSTLMGESVVEITSGSGPPLKPDQARLHLGNASDMYGDLAQSLEQMKNILGSIGEMIGGSDASPMAQKVASFDKFTERIESMAGSLGEKLPPAWDVIDKRLDQGHESTAKLVKNIVNRRDEWQKDLETAQGRLEKWRADLNGSLDSGRKQVAEWRRKANEALKTFAQKVRDQKAPLPLRIREAREWTEKIDGRVETITRGMTRFDQELVQGFASVRQALEGLRVSADDWEEKLWFMAHYPEAVLRRPQGLAGLAMNLEWRRALMGRHYRELRRELEAARREFKPADRSDQARAGHIAEILRDMDAYLLRVQAGETEAAGKAGRGAKER
jgi:ABC-type transporter Mla subunit MlaD